MKILRHYCKNLIVILINGYNYLKQYLFIIKWKKQTKGIQKGNKYTNRH